MILKIQNNINNKFNEFKEILATENPKLNSDDEIDPRFIVTLLLEKMHKELNKTRQIEKNEEQYIITSTFNGQDEDKSNKHEMIDKFVKHFSENFNSFISNLFFGMLKEKKTCHNCNMASYNFGCFCFLTFDLNEINNNNNPMNNNIMLYNLFDMMNKKNKQFTLDDHIYCDRCLSYQIHTQIKQLYSMPLELIISFERGTNCMNKTMINFPFTLDVSQFVESNYSPHKFNLVGCVNRVDINGKEHYISFTKDLNSQNWVCSDDAQINQTDQNMALTYGIPILLFYSSVDNK
jgi:ubiquitin C-terminal hydrolase